MDAKPKAGADAPCVEPVDLPPCCPYHFGFIARH